MLAMGRGHIVLLMLALIALIWLVGSSRSANQSAILSAWRGPVSPAEASSSLANASVNNPLTGFTTQQIGRGNSEQPWGNPLGAANTVMTQGYGVGSHAPAAVWGAIDLALDGNGDGAADPAGSWGQPIYATHAGTVRVTANSWPAGNHVWVRNQSYRTGYAHLQEFAVSSGDYVERGDLLGYIGSTGMSSGPHLDYQVWERRGDSWVNVNPLDYAALDR
jgi:murein DD-endopeptidase MepM/ murein hydrolase activator NlpD